ncbi:MAG: acyl-CoA dehydrogenase, partial [Pseudomonadales bacterium]|nr:acyl-CoA dehydrogenase [Pseudomonadales bacterium]
IVTGSVATCGVIEADGNWDLTDIAASATEQDGQLRLQGTKCFVLDADVAEIAIVSVNLSDGPGLVLLEADEFRDNLVRETVIDETRRSFQLTLDGIVVDKARVLPGKPFQAIENAALLMLSAEMAGGLAGVLDVVVEYLKTRKQFDRYIGSYQALKHPTVDILIGMEGARSHLYHAATISDEGDARQVERALRMAKAQGSEAFAFAGDRAIQFHGGFGFTWECDAQLYLRRALWCQYQFGDERHQRGLLESLLLDDDMARTGLAG